MAGGYYLILFLASSLIAVYATFFALDPLQQRDWLPHYLIYPLVLGSAIFVLSLIPWLRAAIQRTQLQRQHLLVAVVILLAWLFLVSREPTGFKILQDEYVLSAIAMNLHYNRSASVPDRGYWIENNYLIIDGYLDKRPIFFPFLLATTHDILGYDINNVFLLNAVITLFLLWLSYLLARRLGADTRSALLAPIIIASIPLIAQNATGAGFELLNVVMIFLTILLGMQFARQPDARSLTTLCYATFLLAQTRYESSTFILATGVLVLWVWWHERRVILSRAVVLLPLLFILPTLALQAVVMDRFWMQLSDDQAPAFSTALIWQNMSHAAGYLFFFDPYSSMNPIAAILATIGLIAFALLTIAKPQKMSKIFAIFLSVSMFNILIIMSYSWGDISQLYSSRLVLPILVIALICFPFFIVHSRLARRLALIVVSASMIGVAFPTINRHAYDNVLFHHTEDLWALNKIKSNYNEYIMISRYNIFFILNKINVIYPELAIDYSEKLAYLIRNNIYKIYSYQQFFLNNNDAVTFISRSDLHEQFNLQPYKTIAYRPYFYSRVSEIVSISPMVGITRFHYKDYADELRTGVANFPSITPEAQLIWIKQFP